MKERKIFIGSKVKEMCVQHTEVIRTTVAIVIGIAVFIAGFLVSYSFITKPLDDENYEMCKDVTQDVYEQIKQGGDDLFEVPNEVDANVTMTTITVSPKHSEGKVVATLKDGKLEFERVSGIGCAIVDGILVGIFFVGCYSVLYYIFCKIYHKIKKSS